MDGPVTRTLIVDHTGDYVMRRLEDNVAIVQNGPKCMPESFAGAVWKRVVLKRLVICPKGAQVFSSML